MKGFFETIKDRVKAWYREQYGFSESDIDELVEQALCDLEDALNSLRLFLKQEEVNLSEIGNRAHAVKGILFNMGLEDLGMRFKEVQLLAERGDNRALLLLRDLLQDILKSDSS